MELSTIPARLTDAAASLSESAVLITADLDTLLEAVERLERAWSGEAKQAFHEKYASFQRDATAMVDKLGKAAVGLRDLAQEYADADSKSAAAQPTAAP